jgi:hypothetical protein
MKMVYIPLNKALVAIEVDAESDCTGCCFLDELYGCELFSDHHCCEASYREDGKKVIFKFIDLPKDNKTHES